MKRQKASYFGSVRFYKNLIFIVVLLLVFLGVFFSLHYRSRYKELLKKTVVSDGTVDYSVEAEGPYYQSLYPDFYAPQEYGATVRRSREVYLTFDILSYQGTEDILKTLQEKNVKATFFVTGSSDPEEQKILKEIVDNGHTIGMLSWSKDYATVYGSVESYLADMHQISTYIHEATGVTPVVFRFLGGSINSYNTGIYRELIAEMVRRGFVPYDWNVSTQEGQTTPTAEAQTAVVTGALEHMDRAIVLLQDTQDQQILMQALPEIIDAVQATDYSMNPLDPEIKPILFSYNTR